MMDATCGLAAEVPPVAISLPLLMIAMLEAIRNGFSWLSSFRYLPRVETVRGDIRKSTALEIGVRFVILLGFRVDMAMEIVLDSKLLIPSTGEIVAKAAGTGVPCNLGSYALGTADGSDVRAGTWELGRELGLLAPIVRLAGCANSSITGRLKHRDTTKAHQTDQVANPPGIVLGDGLTQLTYEGRCTH